MKVDSLSDEIGEKLIEPPSSLENSFGCFTLRSSVVSADRYMCRDWRLVNGAHAHEPCVVKHTADSSVTVRCLCDLLCFRTVCILYTCRFHMCKDSWITH